MLPKKFRLSQKRDFERVHQRGVFFGHEFLAMKLVKNNLDRSRFGFLVSTKISKKAVVRNKVKRWLRASVTRKLEKIKSGFDLVIFVRPEIVKKDFWEIDKALSLVLKKAELLENLE